MKKIIFFSSFLILLGLLVPTNISARRRLPRATSVKNTAGRAPVTRASRGVNIKVKFRGDRLAIIATFSNLNIASSVEYALTYKSRGTTQAATGVIIPGPEDPTVRELIFGTCSGGICRFDSGITDARLVVTTKLKSGLKIIKPFRLKV